jgi:RNA polymerase sigma-70 factor (ECF subfamily)
MTRPSLLLRLRDLEDGSAWDLFVTTYTPLVYAYCRRRGLQASDVADVTQEVMAQVTRSIAGFSYQRDRGRFRDWLGAVTRSKIVRFLRQQSRPGRPGSATVEELLEQTANPESDTLWTEGFRARLLEVAMSRARPSFEEKTWNLFVGAWVDGKSASELSREFAVPVDAVYVAKSRVLKRLQEEVVALSEDHPLLLTPAADGRPASETSP